MNILDCVISHREYFKVEDSKLERIFLGNGCTVDVKDPLLLALLHGDVKSVVLLLKNGYKLSGSDGYGYTLVWCLFSRKNGKICKKLIKLLFLYNLDTQYSDAIGQNILFIFICYFMNSYNQDALEIVETLVSCGVKVSCLNVHGWTPLLHAIRLENTSVAEFLIKEEVDRNKIYSVDFPLKNFPLILAVITENFKIIGAILKNGGDVNSEVSGRTALHFACEYRSSASIDFLLKNGANLIVKNENGRTPFFLLVHGEEKKILAGDYALCLNTMVKEIAKLEYFGDNSVPAIDMEWIRLNIEARDLFIQFKNVLNKMEITKFYASYTYSDVLKMSKNNVKKLAQLTRNNEFIAKFEDNLDEFRGYENDLRKILEKAIQIRDEELMVEFKLKDLFGHYVSSIGIIEIAKYLNSEDLPL